MTAPAPSYFDTGSWEPRDVVAGRQPDGADHDAERRVPGLDEAGRHEPGR